MPAVLDDPRDCLVPEDGATNVLMVPDLDYAPTLGPAVCRWIEGNLVHGPGDLRGQPVRLDREKRGLLWRMYEVYPPGHDRAGRRRFRRVALSLRKGSAKTELAALIAAAELHPDAPVRCIGWDEDGNPTGGGVTDPYIPMVAFTEEQSDELAFGALHTILTASKVADDFDIGLTRILRADGSGRAVSLANAPSAREGARTTFGVFDETHTWVLPRQLQGHRTMLANLPKRRASDGWTLETTTMPEPGAGSVAEKTLEYARTVAEGRRVDSTLFFFHRQASDEHDLDTPSGLRTAVIEASGPVAEWSDLDAIIDQFSDPSADRAYLERVWLNRPVRATARAFDIEAWRALAAPRTVADGARIVLGFDGSRFHDATAIVACEVASGYLWLAGLWERPLRAADDWEVPAEDVDEVMDGLFRRFDVWRLYADPPYWESTVDAWRGRYGDERILQWWTNRRAPMAMALRAFVSGIASGELAHDGSPDLARHIANAHRKVLTLRGPDEPLWLIQKERSDSPFKIDAAMAAVLAWEARGDAVAAGATVRAAGWLA